MIAKVDPVGKLEGPTAALSATLGRVAAEYFSIVEDIGLSPEGLALGSFWTAIGRMLPAMAREMVNDGCERSEEDLIREYLVYIAKGANEPNKFFPLAKLN